MDHLRRQMGEERFLQARRWTQVPEWARGKGLVDQTTDRREIQEPDHSRSHMRSEALGSRTVQDSDQTASRWSIRGVEASSYCNCSWTRVPNTHDMGQHSSNVDPSKELEWMELLSLISFIRFGAQLSFHSSFVISRALARKSQSAYMHYLRNTREDPWGCVAGLWS